MITVNTIEIPQDAIFNEMQYHPSENIEEAQFKASRSLIIDELFRQRALELDLIGESEVLSESVIDQVIENDVKVPKASTADCQTYYYANKHKFSTFPLLEVKHILLKAAPDDLEDREQMHAIAIELIEQLKQQPDSFEAAAKQYSVCPSKTLGGSLGQLSKGQTVPEFEQQLLRFPAGLVLMPIETRYGLHVVYIERKIEGKQLPYNSVSQKIEHYLNEKVHRKSIAQYIAKRILVSDIRGIDLDVDDRDVMQ